MSNPPHPSTPPVTKPSAAEARASLLAWAEASDAEAKKHLFGGFGFLGGTAVKAAAGVGLGLLATAALKRLVGGKRPNTHKKPTPGTPAAAAEPSGLFGKLFTWELLSRGVSLLAPIIIRRFRSK